MHTYDTAPGTGDTIKQHSSALKIVPGMYEYQEFNMMCVSGHVVPGLASKDVHRGRGLLFSHRIYQVYVQQYDIPKIKFHVEDWPRIFGNAACPRFSHFKASKYCCTVKHKTIKKTSHA